MESGINRWFLRAVLVICASCAALAFFAYVANGMVVGDLIGLPGREDAISIARSRAIWCLTVSALFQAGVAAAIFPFLEFGEEATPFPRIALRAVVAGLISFPCTFVVGTLLFSILKMLHGS